MTPNQTEYFIKNKDIILDLLLKYQKLRKQQNVYFKTRNADVLTECRTNEFSLDNQVRIFIDGINNADQLTFEFSQSAR